MARRTVAFGTLPYCTRRTRRPFGRSNFVTAGSVKGFAAAAGGGVSFVTVVVVVVVVVVLVVVWVCANAALAKRSAASVSVNFRIVVSLFARDDGQDRAVRRPQELLRRLL